MMKKILIFSVAMGTMLYYMCNKAYNMGVDESVKCMIKYFNEHPLETMGEFMDEVI